MKWIERFREKVHAAHTPVSPRANQQCSEGGGSPSFGETKESEQDFRRAWDDFRSAAEKEKDEGLEKVISLFCTISRRTGNPARLILTLVDNRVFAFVVARALVTDIEKLRKASPDGQLQPNDILDYFAGELKDDVRVGGNLLFVIEGLVTPPLDVQPLLEAGLLSSLVIILYRLLYSADSSSSVMATGSTGITRVPEACEEENRRVLVEGSVVHIMKALAQHPGAAQTLAECDRFQYMFHMVVMGGTMVRESPSETLTLKSAPPVHLAQLYRHVLQILELLLASDNGSTAQYIKNHELIEELLTPVVYFVRDTGDPSFTVTVVSLIKNTVQLSCRSEAGGICLKDNLKKGHGYYFFLQLCIKLADTALIIPSENQISDRELIPPQLMRLLDIIEDLTQVGMSATGFNSGSGIAGKVGKPPLSGQLISKSDCMESVAGLESSDGKLRDRDAVQIFQDLFLKSEIVALRIELLDRLLRLFASHPDNYGLVQELRTMPLFIQNMGTYPPLLQERVLKVLEYAVISGNCVPEQELLSLCYLVQQPMATSLRVAVLTFFEKLLSFDRQYKKVLREVGVMELLVDDLKKCEPPLRSPQISLRTGGSPTRASSILPLEREHSSSFNQLIFEDTALVCLGWNCLISLLKKSEVNQMMFRKVKGIPAVLPLLAAPKHRSNVLKLFLCLIGEDLSQAHNDELKALIDAVHSSSVKISDGRQWRVDLETKEDVLWMIWKVLVANPASKIVFGDAQGFALILSVLESFQIDDLSGTGNVLSAVGESETDSGEDLQSFPNLQLRTEVFIALFHVVIAAVSESPTNRNLLHGCLMSPNLSIILRDSGLIDRDFEEKFVGLLFDLALERVHSPSQRTKGLPTLVERDEIGHDYFQLPGVQGYFVVDCNQVVEDEEVYNASAIGVLLFCFLKFSLKLQLRVLIRLKSLACAIPRNQDVLSAVACSPVLIARALGSGCVGLLLDAIRIMLPMPSSLLTCSLQLVEVLGSFRLSSSEIRTLGRYIWQYRDGSGGQTGKIFLETLNRMWSVDFVPESLSLSSFIEFRMSRTGHACVRVPLADRTWPPAAGYSFVCWVRLGNLRSLASVKTEPTGSRFNLDGRKLGTAAPALRIFSVCTAEERSLCCVELFMDDSGGLKLVTSPTQSLSFKGVHLEEERWYHLVLVHSKPNALAGLFQSSVAYLYLNGKLCDTGKLGYCTPPIGKPLQVVIGTPAAQAETCSIPWRLGSCYLFEEALPAPSVFFMHVMGRAYRGLFQDPNLVRFIPLEACGSGDLALLETLDIEQRAYSAVQKGEGSVRRREGSSRRGEVLVRPGADLLGSESGAIVWDQEKFANIAQLSGRKLIFALDGTFSSRLVCTAAVTMVNLVDSQSAAASSSGGLSCDAELSGDVHICNPSSISDSVRKVGGVAVVLAMVEASKSKEMLHLSLTLLHSILKYNPRNVRNMQKCRGYHLLALFLHHRMEFFDIQCLDLLFKIATCQAASPVKTVPGSERQGQLQKAMCIQEPVRQISEVSDSVTRLVHVDSGIDSGLDVCSNPSRFDDQASSFSSLFDPAESFGPESSMGAGISELGVADRNMEDDNCDILSNPDMMVHVFLDWILWGTASPSIQLAVLGIVGRLVSTKRHRKYNMTVLRRLNLMQHLLVILDLLMQRSDEILVFETVAELLTLILIDGFISSELQQLANFVVMTFDPSSSIEGTSAVAGPVSNQVKVRNMLLDKLIELQFLLKSDEIKTEEWNKVVSSKVINHLLDEAVHHHSMRLVVTLLGLCLESSCTFTTRFKTTGGYQLLAHVLPSFFDSPDIYFILFKLLFNQTVYPRQPEVRILDFHGLMPKDGKSGDICFPELVEVVLAMCRAAFNRVLKQSLTAHESAFFSDFNVSLCRSYTGATEDPGEALQGEALLHKTYAARLMGGEAAAPSLITSILRFMVDLAKMYHPFTIACRRTEFLESFVDLYFTCVRAAGAVQLTQEALADLLRSEQGEDINVSDESVPQKLNENDSEVYGISRHEPKPEKTFSAELLASVFSENPVDTIQLMTYEATVEYSPSFPKHEEHASRSLYAGLQSSTRCGQCDSPTASQVSSSVGTPKLENLGSPRGSFVGAPQETFSRLRTLSSLTATCSDGESSSRYRSSAFFSSTPRSEVDSLFCDFGAASSGRFTPRDSTDAIVTPKLLLQLDSLGSSGGSCAASAAAILDLIAEVLADALTDQLKGMALVEAATEAVPLSVGSNTMLVFQGLCLGRMINFLERRLLRDEEEHRKKLDKSRWAPNLDTLSWLLVDRAFMGAFSDPGAPIKVLEFLLAMLQLANSDGRVEEAVPAAKGLLALARGGNRQLEPYVQALLKNTNRMIMFCLLPTPLGAGHGDEYLPLCFRRNSNSLLQSLDCLPHFAGATEKRGANFQEIDKVTVLQLILANKKLIFCASNVDSDLLCALCVNVTPLLWDPDPSTRSLAVGLWRALVLHRSPALEDILIWKGTQCEMNVDVLHNGFNLLLTHGFKDFYAWIEDAWEFQVKKVLEQRATVVWKEYVQGASRFSGVRIKPLEGRRKREMTRRSRDMSKIDRSQRELVAKSRSALERVRESTAEELRILRQDKYAWILHAEREWEKHIQHLVHERGLWPMVSASIDGASSGKPVWHLCTKEGPFRMRKKLERLKISQADINDTSLEGEESPGRECIRREKLKREGTPPSLSADHPDFKIPHLRVNSQDFFKPIDHEDDQSKAEGVDDDDSSSAHVPWSDVQPTSGAILENQAPDSARSEEESQLDGRENPSSVQGLEEAFHSVDTQSTESDANEDGEYLIRPFLEPGEKLKFRYNCERVIGLDKRDGIFLIGEHCLYVIDNYYIDEEGCIKEKEDEGIISVIDKKLGVSMSGSNHSQDGMKQSSGSRGENVSVDWQGGKEWARWPGGAWGKEKVRTCQSLRHTWHMWKLDSVHELLKRQYQLRPVAIELFSMDGVNELLVFLKIERDEVFKNLLAQGLPRNSMLDTTISGASKQVGTEGSRLFKILAKSFSNRWQNGEISNFQYLMHLNTLAGRGYNDITQYPVYPWVLADYESEELDLTKPATFRCLEKPMGAHHPSREEAFKTRYDNWDDSDIPRFHYGSHYSSAGIVLFYLVRLPPFSIENKKLQGGDFDHADRLFSSLQDTWLSASQGNTADVKELIPEFFYLPEFLENRFDLDLGVKQSGEKVDHVRLPPWAKGSAREFIRKHREALESQYVSENLHHWIDLIFGFKQRGKAAVEATNVFYHLTYDGAVDIDSVEDPAMKAAILAQINHFGQTPRQLFRKPHPKRRWVPRPALALVPYSFHTVVPQKIRTMVSKVSEIVLNQNTLFVATANRVLRPPAYDKFVAWGFPDRSLRFMSYDQERVLSTHENLHDDGPVTCAGFSRDGQILVTGGEDGVVSVWRFAFPSSNSSSIHLQQSLCAHTQAVTCLAVSQSYSVVVSASEDRTVVIWDLIGLEYVRQLPELPSPATALHINDMSGEVVTAVGPILTVWSINGDCLAAVNTSETFADTILSITSPQESDWTEAGWYITGHQSGEIQLWRMSFNSLSGANGMSRLHTKSSSDSCATPVKPKSKAPSRWVALPASTDLRRLNSVVETVEDSTKPVCISGGTPEFQLLRIKVLSWHKEPVTAVCLGNDLKQMCSGDSGGHVVSWTLLDDVSKNLPLLVGTHSSCNTRLMKKEIFCHCRNCGQIVRYNFCELFDFH